MAITQATYKYMEVYNSIRSDILLKNYPDNTLLPTENLLMEKYGVSRNTIRKAIKMLQENGFITTKQGSGSVVHTIHKGNLLDKTPTSMPPWSAPAGSVEYRKSYDSITVSRGALDIVPAPKEVAERFQIPANSEVYRVQRIWKMDNVPYNYQIQYVNPSVFPDFHKYMDEDRKIRRLLEKRHDLHTLYNEEHIACVNAGFIEAGLLNVEPGTALMHTVRFAHCEKGVYEYAIFYGNPEYTGYVMRMD